MSNNNYYKQVALLISVIPEIAVDSRFALHGGTAINLFDRNMPRLSVDIKWFKFIFFTPFFNSIRIL